MCIFSQLIILTIAYYGAGAKRSNVLSAPQTAIIY